MLLKARNIPGDRILNIQARFLARGSLGHAPRKRRACRNKATVFILFDQDPELHTVMIAASAPSHNLVLP